MATILKHDTIKYAKLNILSFFILNNYSKQNNDFILHFDK